MADRTRVPTNLPKFTGKRGEDVREWLFQIENACRINSIAIEDTSTRLPNIAGSAMEKPGAGWFLHWSSTTRAEELTWLTFREHALQHFEASNYQAVLREKLQRLRQIGDIETYNGKYSALIFRVEGMSTLDQVMHYTNGLKSRTKSYVKLENPETLSETMDLAVKYEVTHFIDDVHHHQSRQEKKKPQVDQPNNQGGTSRRNPSVEKVGSNRARRTRLVNGAPATFARNRVTLRPTVSCGRKSNPSRETSKHVSE
ncbi:unnamed protein product [Phytophthora fragariaefolia]|uniref:Unnamed protein product n=1 Tax=Phytophthora fragariaefolia TaxID=1490495 RepID=A0A9W6Y7F4_9STRA|nr:unnamed protein product [Phytophthora fragariaefolia]